MIFVEISAAFAQMAALLSKENEGANDWPRKGGWKMEHAQAACQRNAEVIAILMEIADVARRLADKLADLDKEDDCEGGKAYEQDGRLGCRHCRTAQMRRSHYQCF